VVSVRIGFEVTVSDCNPGIPDGFPVPKSSCAVASDCNPGIPGGFSILKSRDWKMVPGLQSLVTIQECQDCNLVIFCYLQPGVDTQAIFNDSDIVCIITSMTKNLMLRLRLIVDEFCTCIFVPVVYMLHSYVMPIMKCNYYHDLFCIILTKYFVIFHYLFVVYSIIMKIFCLPTGI